MVLNMCRCGGRMHKKTLNEMRLVELKEELPEYAKIRIVTQDGCNNKIVRI